MARRRWKIQDIKQVVEGESPFIQVGYEKTESRHKIGDEWVDAKGIRWIQKNGYRERVNKQVDSIRELIRQKCSRCGKDVNLFGNRYDDKLFPKTGMCYDCLIDYETVLRIEGKYENYEKRKVLSNRLGMLNELRVHVVESIEYLKKSDGKLTFASNGFGDVETWSGMDYESMLKIAEDDLVKIDDDIKNTKTTLDTIPSIE